jgi:hypothetical protein
LSIKHYFRIKIKNLITVGFNQPGFTNSKTFDEGFYNTVNLPFEYRFSKFKFDRNIEKESEVYNELSLHGELIGYEVCERFYEIGSLQGIDDTNYYLLNKAKTFNYELLKKTSK